MEYNTLDLKIDQFVGYVNDNKVNLIPPFQRGHVWKLKQRQKLLENIVRGRPIPAIFLYREASGEKYSYNILDGKQRLESLILFIGDERPSLKIRQPTRFFFERKLAQQANFKITVNGKTQSLKEMDESLFRDFREYVIPTIEITLSDESPAALDEIIDLFVDINSYGEKVKRFDIVKAMSQDFLLRDTFALVAQKEKRGKDVFYKAKNNDFTWVLKKLQIVAGLQEANSRVDRMWELLVEIVLFIRTKKHRAPVDILKSFIKAKDQEQSQPKISVAEKAELRKVFKFLKAAYANASLIGTRLVTNQIHFYTMITAIIADDLITKHSTATLVKKLAKFGQLIDGEDVVIPSKFRDEFKEYLSLSAKHTTHPGRRGERVAKFVKIIDEL